MFLGGTLCKCTHDQRHRGTAAKALGKLGIVTLRDLIGWFPRRYEDRALCEADHGPHPW